MELDSELIPLPTTRKQKGSLVSQMQSLSKGQSFTVKKKSKHTRKGLYSTAKLAKVKITTQETALGTIRVWRTDGEEKVLEQSPYRLVSDNDIEILDKETGEVPVTHKEKLDGLRDLMGIASSGVKASEIYGDESVAEIPVSEDWRFTKKPTQYHDNGNVYREQVLYPAGKRFRTVEVDIDDQDTIIG